MIEQVGAAAWIGIRVAIGILACTLTLSVGALVCVAWAWLVMALWLRPLLWWQHRKAEHDLKAAQDLLKEVEGKARWPE